MQRRDYIQWIWYIKPLGSLPRVQRLLLRLLWASKWLAMILKTVPGVPENPPDYVKDWATTIPERSDITSTRLCKCESILPWLRRTRGSKCILPNDMECPVTHLCHIPPLNHHPAWVNYTATVPKNWRILQYDWDQTYLFHITWHWTNLYTITIEKNILYIRSDGFIMNKGMTNFDQMTA